ncbi:hypothetical protein JCM8547_004107 [Rhodosporidiobolus lusitaniae]
MAAVFDPSTLRTAITAILNGADKSSIGVKAVRKQLQAQYPHLDIKAHKEAIDALTTEIFVAMNEPEADSSEEEKPLAASKPSKPKLPTIRKIKQLSPDGNGMPESSPSYPLAGGRGAHDDDEAVARALQAAYNAPERATRNGGVSSSSSKSKKKSKSKKRVDSDDDSGLDDSDGAPAKKKKKTKAKLSGKAVDRRKNSAGFNKLYLLSDELAEVTGHKVLSRAGCTKYLWKYIKGNGLQDPAKKTDILPDDKLFEVFPQGRFTSFQMAKLLGKHLYPYDDDEHGKFVKDYTDDEGAGSPAVASSDLVDSDDE